MGEPPSRRRPRTDRWTLRLLKLAKDSAVKARTQAINQLKAVLVTADPSLRESLAGLGRATLIRRCAQLPDPAGDGDVAATVVYTLRLLAHRIQHLTSETNDLTRRISGILTSHAPDLLERRGIGPDTAATLLITAGDNPDWLATEASFAALCGASPVEASSGRTRRHRLNRGGNRQANAAALYRIALTRLRCDRGTRDYLDRRAAEGKTRREATGVVPVEVITDRAPTYPRVLDQLWPAAWHHIERYANNRVEADHAQLKRRLRPMRGIKTITGLRVLATGHAFVQNLRRGHYEIAADQPTNLRLPVAFRELASAI